MNLKKKAFMKPLATILSFILLFITVPLHRAIATPEIGLVVGMVVSGDYTSPIKGAIVKLYDPKTGEFYTSSPTDENGMYTIKNVPVGEFNIVITTKDGDFPCDLMVRVRAELPTALILALEPGKKPLAAGLGKKAKWFQKWWGTALIIGAAAATGYGVYKAVASPETP